MSTPVKHRARPTDPDACSVRRFWESNPLFSLEASADPGTREFFERHDAVRAEDVERFALPLYEFDRHRGERVLDVGCGIGWLCRSFAAGGARVTGLDITRRAVELTRRRLELGGLEATLVQASAEDLPFPSDAFDFVTAAGVLHHTPDTRKAVDEVYRVVRHGGRALIALYYRNALMRPTVWPLTAVFVRALLARVPGRDALRRVRSVEDFVRIWDGNENPIGKAYSRDEVRRLLGRFEIERLELHYFPRRFMPFARWLPRWLHRLLDRHCGLMIYATLRKHSAGAVT